MILAFTGTRRGMTDVQKTEVARILCAVKPDTVYHGDCVGADAEFHDLVREHLLETKIVIWPGPSGDDLRARKQGDEIKPVMNHLARNRAMVDGAQVVIGAPFENERQTRGGTWYTIDYSAKKCRARYLCKPDGGVIEAACSEDS